MCILQNLCHGGDSCEDVLLDGIEENMISFRDVSKNSLQFRYRLFHGVVVGIGNPVIAVSNKERKIGII